MKVTLVGYRNLSFTTKTGDVVNGCKVFVIAPSVDVQGYEPFGYFVKSEDIRDRLNLDLDKSLGTQVDVEVDLKGHLVAISVA